MKSKYNKYEDILIYVGGRIKDRRSELGMRQVDLAEKMGYKYPQTIIMTENGRTDIGLSRLYDYSKVLECNLEYLIYEQEPWARPAIKDEALGKAPFTQIQEAAQKVFMLQQEKAELEAKLEEALTRLEELSNKKYNEFD